MPQTSPTPKAETLTCRIEPALKAAFARIADQEKKPVGELLRELVRERVERKRRLMFEAEARRQSMAAAAVADDPDSDAATLLRELEANLAELGSEWK